MPFQPYPLYIPFLDSLQQLFPNEDITLIADEFLFHFNTDAFLVKRHYTDNPGLGPYTTFIYLTEDTVPDLRLSLPRLPGFYFKIGDGFLGTEEVIKIIFTEEDNGSKSLKLDGIRFSIGVETSLLKPVDPSREYPEIIFFGGIKFYDTWNVELDAETGFSFPECELADTGITISLTNVIPDFSIERTPEPVILLGYDNSFKGLYAREGKIKLLPQSIFNNKHGVEIDLDNIAISKQGVSFEAAATFDLTFNSEKTDVTGGDFKGSLFGFMVALRYVSIRVLNNAPEEFEIAGFIKLPFLINTLFEVSFGLEAVGKKSFKSTLTIKGNELDIKSLLPFSQDSNHFIKTGPFELTGILTEERLNIKGKVNNIFINLPGLLPASADSPTDPTQLKVESVDFNFMHNSDSDEFRLAMHNIPMGILGKVDRAEFFVKKSTSEDGEENKEIKLSTSFSWEDLREKLPDLPEQFKQLIPADDAKVEASIEWRSKKDSSNNSYTEIHIKLLAELDDPLQIWDVFNLPEKARVEVDHIKLGFDILFKEGEEATAIANNKFKGEFSVQLDVKLPPVPEIVEGLQISTGNSEGWITLKAELKTSGTSDTSIHCSIESLIQAKVKLPGLNQIDPNVITSLDKADFKFLVKEENGQPQTEIAISLTGSYLLRLDIDKLPLPETLKQIFNFIKKSGIEVNSVPVLKGKVVGTVSIKPGNANQDIAWKVSLQCLLNDLDAKLDINNLLNFFSKGTGVPDGFKAKEILLGNMDFGCGLEMLEMSLSNYRDDQKTSTSPFNFKVHLKGGLQFITIKTPVFIEFTEKTFALGFDESPLPLELSLPPIDENLFDYTAGDVNGWYTNKLLQLEIKLSALPEENLSISQQKQMRNLMIQKWLVEMSWQFCNQMDTSSGKVNYLKWLNLLALQYSTLFKWNKPEGSEEASGFDFDLKGIPYIKLDELIKGNTDRAISLDDTAQLFLKGIRMEIDPFDFRKSSVSGSIKFANFKKDNLFRVLEIIEWQLGLTSELLYFTLKSPAKFYFPQLGDLEGVPIHEIFNLPGLLGGQFSPAEEIEKNKKGFIRIDKALLGFGYTKRSFAFQFEGECRLPDQLLDVLKHFQTSNTGGAFYFLPPRKTSLYVKFELIPIPAGQVVIVIPYFEFALDLRSEVSPGLISARGCVPYWDGLQVHIKDMFELGLKHIGFSPIFLGDIAPIVPFSFDANIGNDQFGISCILDNYIYCYGKFIPYIILPYPLLYDPIIPWADNACFNVRFAGFGINFNFQKPIPNFGLDALFETLAVISDPQYKINPDGTLGNCLRIALTDVYITIPEYARQFLPGIPDAFTKPVDLVLNVATFQHLFVNLLKQTERFKKLMPFEASNEADTYDKKIKYFSSKIEAEVGRLMNELSPGQILKEVSSVLESLPIEARTFSTEANFGGFRARASVAISSVPEIQKLLRDQRAEREAIELEGSITITDTKNKLSGLKTEMFAEIDPGKPAVGYTLKFSDLADKKSILFSNELKYFDYQVLNELINEIGTEAKGIIAGADINIAGLQTFNFIGFIGQLGTKGDHGFVLISQVNNPQISLSLQTFTIPIPLSVKGKLKLAYSLPNESLTKIRASAGEAIENLSEDLSGSAFERIYKTSLAGTGLVEARFSSVWDALPGVLRVCLGTTHTETISNIFIHIAVTISGKNGKSSNAKSRTSGKEKTLEGLHSFKWDEKDKKYLLKEQAENPKEKVKKIKPEVFAKKLQVMMDNNNKGEKESELRGMALRLVEEVYKINKNKSFSAANPSTVKWRKDKEAFIFENSGQSIKVLAEELGRYFNNANEKPGINHAGSGKSKTRAVKKLNFDGQKEDRKKVIEPCSIIIDSQGSFFISGNGQIAFFPGMEDLTALLTCESLIATNTFFSSKGNFEFNYTLPSHLFPDSNTINFKASGSIKVSSYNQFELKGELTEDMNLFGLAFKSTFLLNQHLLNLHCSINSRNPQTLHLLNFKILLLETEADCTIGFKNGVNVRLAGNFDMQIVEFNHLQLNLSIQGKGEFSYTSSGSVSLLVEGKMTWAGCEWIGCKVKVTDQGFSVAGYTSFRRKFQPGNNMPSMFIEANVLADFNFNYEAGKLRLQGDTKLSGSCSAGVIINNQEVPIASGKIYGESLISLPGIGSNSLPIQGLQLLKLPTGTRSFGFVPLIEDGKKWLSDLSFSVTGSLPIPERRGTIIGSLARTFRIDASNTGVGDIPAIAPLSSINPQEIADVLFPKLQKEVAVYLVWKDYRLQLKVDTDANSGQFLEL